MRKLLHFLNRFFSSFGVDIVGLVFYVLIMWLMIWGIFYPNQVLAIYILLGVNMVLFQLYLKAVVESIINNIKYFTR